jgi:hypothetical protein
VSHRRVPRRRARKSIELIMNPPAPITGKMMAEDERELAKSAA